MFYKRIFYSRTLKEYVSVGGGTYVMFYNNYNIYLINRPARDKT